jgi:hypothetical protein
MRLGFWRRRKMSAAEFLQAFMIEVTGHELALEPPKPSLRKLLEDYHTRDLYKFTCPHCGSRLNPDARKDEPTAGDALLCTGCDTVLIYVDRLTLRAATKDEEKEILGEHRGAVLRR